MQLAKIKLAGFKSFVDPTTVMIPSNLVAVVGPNGCGKSNIIDAITWVLGESSAKYLRGESLTDVIFNGATTRKPVGQATVELVFDNSDGTLGGEFSQYSEISVRRLINRLGDSHYYLNGTRCRRKDVIDIFLGTGLGPRSYSIIGQNMISRIIEAKPDELRVYLEEAAGVSKYKERRRETENRIEHSKENLARLNDIRAELEKQLQTLQRQADAAEKFKTLKQEERSLRLGCFALQWKDLNEQMGQHSLKIQRQETATVAKQTELSSVTHNLESKRDKQTEANEALHEAQKHYYVAGNDIARIEQEIRHHQNLQEKWQTDLAEVKKEWQDATEQLQEIEDQIKECTSDLSQLEPQTQTAKKEMSQAITNLSAAENKLHQWQAASDEFNQFVAKTTQTAEVEQTRIQHLEQKLVSLKQRQENLAKEQKQINFANLEDEIKTLSEQANNAKSTLDQHQTHLQQTRADYKKLQEQQQKVTAQLDKVRSTLQELRGNHASLEALQQTALGQRNNDLMGWLKENNLAQNQRLAQGLKVDSGWELAVEKVLGSCLQAVCVNDLTDVSAAIEKFKNGTLNIFATRKVAVTPSSKAQTLASKIQSKWPVDALFAGIYIADTLKQALGLCKNLEAHESVVTADGVWLSPNWLQVTAESNLAEGVFQREQELKQLSENISKQEAEKKSLENSLTQINQQLQESDTQREKNQKAVNDAHSLAAEVQARLKMQQERLSDLKKRSDQLNREAAESRAQSETATEDLKKSRALREQALKQLEQHAEKRKILNLERDQVKSALQAAQDAVNHTREEFSQLQIRLQTTRSQQGNLKQTVVRLQSQMTACSKRKNNLEAELASATSIPELKKQLDVILGKRFQLESNLKAARQVVETIEQEYRELEQQRQVIEGEISKSRDTLEKYRIENQSLKVKSENLLTQIAELNTSLEEILPTLAEDAQLEQYQLQLEQVGRRITRLGPINLVAIEEYTTCSERKDYLDAQYNDLIDGLQTLEDAIAKIDRETRTRFKETFDKVNMRFQELFPTIFGGGRAELELTGENLLEAGINVMACPPGKRNSTIHLLSGGEKALTALALVFSIFHLNPAPFCLLDEVDASLDDPNVDRFCKLVKLMSEKTQFLFISHNKLAIEMGQHLIGVTMHEPGVSRLVSVDIEEAISLASV